jgi:hypothetical protein
MKIRYIIGENVYNIRTNICVRLCEFDKSYAEKLGQNPLNVGDNCNRFSYCNKLVPGKDYIKIMCHIKKFLINFLKYSNVTNPEYINFDFLNSFYGDNECFLRGADGNKIPDENYEQFNYILSFNNLYKNLTQIDPNNKFEDQYDQVFSTNIIGPDGNITLNYDESQEIAEALKRRRLEEIRRQEELRRQQEEAIRAEEIRRQEELRRQQEEAQRQREARQRQQEEEFRKRQREEERRQQEEAERIKREQYSERPSQSRYNKPFNEMKYPDECKKVLCTEFNNIEHQDKYPTKKEYIKWAKTNHPDKGGDNDKFAYITRCFQEDNKCQRGSYEEMQANLYK